MWGVHKCPLCCLAAVRNAPINSLPQCGPDRAFGLRFDLLKLKYPRPSSVGTDVGFDDVVFLIPYSWSFLTD